MAWADLLAGLAFYLIFEGLFPFVAAAAVAARAWRHSRGSRKVGCGCSVSAAVIAGLVLLFSVRG